MELLKLMEQGSHIIFDLHGIDRHKYIHKVGSIGANMNEEPLCPWAIMSFWGNQSILDATSLGTSPIDGGIWVGLNTGLDCCNLAVRESSGGTDGT